MSHGSIIRGPCSFTLPLHGPAMIDLTPFARQTLVAPDGLVSPGGLRFDPSLFVEKPALARFSALELENLFLLHKAVGAHNAPEFMRLRPLISDELFAAAAHTAQLDPLAAALGARNAEAFSELAPQWPLRAVSPDGATYLMIAASNGFSDAVALLIPHSDAKLADPLGMTALLYAIEHRSPESIRHLIAHSDLEARDNNGMTALMAAASSGEPELRELIDHGDPLATDHQGMTALMHAASGAKNNCVELLLPRSDVFARDKEHGFTALDFALQRARRHPKAVQLLREAMARAEQKAIAQVVSDATPASATQTPSAGERDAAQRLSRRPPRAL